MNNLRLAVWMVVRNDGWYIDMAIKSVLPYVDGLYILDNGSTDETIDVIKSFNSSKIYLEEINYDFDRPCPGIDETPVHPYWKWDPTRDGNSFEAETRNRCVKACTDTFRPDWLIQIDADEVYTPLFFEQLKNYNLSKTISIKHATDRFVSRTQKACWPNQKYYDPHSRSWNPGLGIKWEKQGKDGGHVIPRLPGGKPLQHVWMDGIVHIHLHRTFGPKSQLFWETQKESDKKFNPRVNQKRFEQIYNIETCVDANFDWNGLEFVIQKWEEWGIW